MWNRGNDIEVESEGISVSQAPAPMLGFKLFFDAAGLAVCGHILANELLQFGLTVRAETRARFKNGEA